MERCEQSWCLELVQPWQVEGTVTGQGDRPTTSSPSVQIPAVSTSVSRPALLDSWMHLVSTLPRLPYFVRVTQNSRKHCACDVITEDTNQGEAEEDSHDVTLHMWWVVHTSVCVQSTGCLEFSAVRYLDMMDRTSVTYSSQLPSLPRRAGAQPQPSKHWLVFVAWPHPVSSHLEEAWS